MTPHFSAEAFERAAAPDRGAMRSHARACDACRDALLEAEPTAIFSFLADAPVPAEVLSAVTAESVLRSGVEAPDGASSRRLPRMAAIAAAVALLALLLPWTSTGPELPAPLEDRANVAVLDSPGSPQVIDLTVGETQVVMIFDAELDL